MRRDEEHILRKVLRMDTPGKRKRGRPKKMERCVPTRLETYWTESGRGDGRGDVEKEDHQSYRRPYMMGKAGEKKRKRRCRSISLMKISAFLIM